MLGSAATGSGFDIRIDVPCAFRAKAKSKTALESSIC